MAIAEHGFPAVHREAPPERLVPFPVPAPLRRCGDPGGWHEAHLARRAATALAQLERALALHRFGRARRLRSRWMRLAQLDRLARARALALEAGLRLDPMGRGPVPEVETIFYRDHLPWRLSPRRRWESDGLPARAALALESWSDAGDVFDCFVVADEPPGTAPFPTHCLIGAISGDGEWGEWFVLDRWAS